VPDAQNDMDSDRTYPFGSLTRVGVQQMCDRGAQLREAGVPCEDVAVVSSNFSRTAASAEALAWGLTGAVHAARRTQRSVCPIAPYESAMGLDEAAREVLRSDIVREEERRLSETAEAFQQLVPYFQGDGPDPAAPGVMSTYTRPSKH
jgi:broad specificity phosphatase PhoE